MVILIVILILFCIALSIIQIATIKQEILNEMQTKHEANDPVKTEMHKVKFLYAQILRECTGSYVWDHIQRLACLENGYSQMKWVDDSDAEKVAQSAKEMCEEILNKFKEKKQNGK